MGRSVASRFDSIAVEQSMLLGVVVNDDELTLEMEFCLEPGHPAYEAPGQGDACCFHPGSIRFGGIGSLVLERTEAASGQRRYPIRAFAIEGSRCHLASDWGAIQLQARSIRVVMK